MTQADNQLAGSSPDHPGDPGTLVFENDRVRIWELIMKPGEICNWHVHEHDHLLLLIDGCDVEARFADGNNLSVPFPDNSVVYVPQSPLPETAKNASTDRTLRELIIELKDPPGAAAQEMGSAVFFQDGAPTTARPE